MKHVRFRTERPRFSWSRQMAPARAAFQVVLSKRAPRMQLLFPMVNSSDSFPRNAAELTHLPDLETNLIRLMNLSLIHSHTEASAFWRHHSRLLLFIPPPLVGVLNKRYQFSIRLAAKTRIFNQLTTRPHSNDISSVDRSFVWLLLRVRMSFNIGVSRSRQSRS